MIKPSSKTCKICRERFFPRSSLSKTCSYKCAIQYVRQHEAEKKRRDQKKAERANRQAIRKAKERLKTRSDWLKDAQKVVNLYIRERDKDFPCISCGRYHEGQYHASHYRSVGACSSLRFHEMNIHKSCQPCNSHKSGNIVEYRIALVEKIGLKNVEWLESQPKAYRWEIDDIKDIIKWYKQRLKWCRNESKVD